MGEKDCPRCGKTGSVEKFSVDRLGVYHWFRQCEHCGHRWGTQHVETAYDNPYNRLSPNAWRPDPAPQSRF